MQKITWPPTLPGAQNVGTYSLNKSNEENENFYARYETSERMGFKQAIEIHSAGHRENPTWTHLCVVRHLSGNTFGKGTWIQISEEAYPDLATALQLCVENCVFQKENANHDLSSR